jgi:hypothetical protein
VLFAKRYLITQAAMPFWRRRLLLYKNLLTVKFFLRPGGLYPACKKWYHGKDEQ